MKTKKQTRNTHSKAGFLFFFDVHPARWFLANRHIVDPTLHACFFLLSHHVSVKQFRAKFWLNGNTVVSDLDCFFVGEGVLVVFRFVFVHHLGGREICKTENVKLGFWITNSIVVLFRSSVWASACLETSPDLWQHKQLIVCLLLFEIQAESMYITWSFGLGLVLGFCVGVNRSREAPSNDSNIYI